MTIFHTSIITTLQPPKEKQIIPVYNGVGAQRETLKNISIKWGTGTYKLQKPNGSKEGIISWSQYGQDQLIDKLLNLGVDLHSRWMYNINDNFSYFYYHHFTTP